MSHLVGMSVSQAFLPCISSNDCPACCACPGPAAPSRSSQTGGLLPTGSASARSGSTLPTGVQLATPLIVSAPLRVAVQLRLARPVCRLSALLHPDSPDLQVLCRFFGFPVAFPSFRTTLSLSAGVHPTTPTLQCPASPKAVAIHSPRGGRAT